MPNPRNRGVEWGRFAFGWGLIALGVALLILAERVLSEGGQTVWAGVAFPFEAITAAGVLPLLSGIWIVRRWARRTRRHTSTPDPTD